MKSIAFSVTGDPVPQPRVRVSTRGGFARAYVPGKHQIHTYRQAIAAAAAAAGATATDEEPLTVILDLVFSRPASHKNKSGLRKGAPVQPRPDVDNVAKGILDSLNGVAWADDRQVGKLVVEKSYGEEPRTTVRIQ
jgi:Holliday junction resolvase RusA-like endonuclease